MKRIAVVLLTVITTVTYAQNRVWSLEDCVNYAMENNLDVQRGLNTLLSNEQDIEGARGNLYPSLNANLSQSMSVGTVELFQGEFVDRTFHSTGAGISLNQNVYSGMRNRMQLKRSELTYDINEINLNLTRDNIMLNVATQYLNVLFNVENLNVARAQYEFSKTQLDQVRSLVDAGVQPQANIYDAEATLANDAQNVTVAENNYQLALLSLSQLLQLPFEGFQVEIVQLDDPAAELMYEDINMIMNYAMANRNEIKFAEKNIENAHLATSIAKSGYYPSVSFGYGFNTAANFSNLTSSNSFFQQINDNKGHSFNVNVGIPIFSRLQNKTNVARSKIQEETSKLNLEQAKLDLESNIQSAYTDAQAALKTYEAAKKSLEFQELAFENARDRYNLGSMNAFELDQARIRYINAQSNQIRSKYDFVFKTKVLDFYLGKPIVL